MFKVDEPLTRQVLVSNIARLSDVLGMVFFHSDPDESIASVIMGTQPDMG